ncbi:MAG TPA: DUF3703 domain-containing protein [Vicinamibacteria bacterium]|nr:DUF3703 domain-containing protein [Vicinamibacteria bacterium]
MTRLLFGAAGSVPFQPDNKGIKLTKPSHGFRVFVNVSNGEQFMNPVQNVAFANEIALAKELIAKGELEASFSHLERAHIIGQAFVVPHAISHWLMLTVEVRRRRVTAALGQIVRIVLGMLGSAVGVVPVGNTGGTDISMFKRMPIEPELQNIIDSLPPNPGA